MASTNSKMLTLSLTPDVHGALVEAASRNGWTPESLAADVIADHLDSAIRYRVLDERMATVDQALIDIASLVGEATAAADVVAGGGGLDLSSVCRYKSAGR